MAIKAPAFIKDPVATPRGWTNKKGELLKAEFLALNPNALVPVITDEDFVLWESNSICRYLASSMERWDLLPRSPKPKAHVEQWMDWQATELNNSWRYAFMALVRKNPSFNRLA